MIIQEQTKDVVVIGEDTSKRAKISQDKLAKLQYLLTKGLYKDPITAVIAEWTNNGIDSVVQAGKNPIENPVLVKIEKNTTGQYVFSVEDKGVGLDDRDFEDICMNYLESTKESDNDTIGHFGIGMKSFLSLERSATFICRKNGIERKYIVYEGEEFVNFDLVYSNPTDEENGVKAELVINGWSEGTSFKDKAIQKLAYYDTAVLIIDNKIIENKIYRSENFQWSSLNKNPILHICLKDVYYTIDWEALGISPISIPLGIRIGLDEGITPTPSRESYITNEKTKNLILSKISDIAQFFVEKYNSTIKEFDTFLDAYPHLGISSYDVVLEGNTFNINPLLKYSKVPVVTPKVKGITIMNPVVYKNLKDELLKEYSVAAYTDVYGVTRSSIKRYYLDPARHVMEKKKVVLVSSPFAGNVKEFLKGKHGKETLFVYENGFKRILGTRNDHQNYQSYRYILSLSTLDRKKWKERIHEYNFVVSTIVSTFIDERDAISSPEFVKWQDAKKEALKQKRILNKTNGNYRGLNKQEGDVTIAYNYKSIRGVSFKKEAIPIKNLYNNKFVTVLIEEGDDIEKIKSFIPAFAKCPTIRFATIGKKEIKKIPNNYQFINVKKFMSIECKPFLRLASAIVFEKALTDLNKIKSYKSQVFKKFVSHIDKDANELQDYVNRNMSYISDEVKTTILEVADEYKLYDLSMWDVYLRVKEAAKKYDFINLLQEPSYYNQELNAKYEKLINQILLFRKKYYDDLPEGAKIVFE